MRARHRRGPGALWRVGPALLAVACPAALAGVDGLTFAAGSADGADLVRAGLVAFADEAWLERGALRLGHNVEFAASLWRVAQDGGSRRSLHALSVIPALRLSPSGGGWRVRPFAEVGVGANLLSRTVDNDNAQLSTRFEFSEHLGVGLRFEGDAPVEVALRHRHLSNGGLREPNHGLDVNELAVTVRFR